LRSPVADAAKHEDAAAGKLIQGEVSRRGQKTRPPADLAERQISITWRSRDWRRAGCWANQHARCTAASFHTLANMDLSTWGVGLLALMFVLLLVELFLPTGGLLGTSALIAGLAGLVCLFRYDTAWGFSGLLATVILLPAFAGFAFRIWPSTPMGRRIIGAPTEEALEESQLQELKEKERLAALVGREGMVITTLRPVGVVEIDGVRHDALAETMFVQSGSRVKVVYADGSQIKVREV